MADKNIQMQRKNADGTLDSFYPMTKAANVSIADAGALFTAGNVEGALSELFTSVSDGKTLLETAVTDMEGVVSKAGAVATFAELDSGIRSIETAPPQGEQTFLSSGTFIPPAGVEYVDVFLVGGGGGGYSGAFTSSTDYKGGGGGGGGYAVTLAGLPVTPGNSYAVTIGAGGAECASGNASSIQVDSGSFTALGGYRGARGKDASGEYYSWGGSGGSAGGKAQAAGASDGGHTALPFASASNGDNNDATHSRGQTLTTRAWGMPAGARYSGGGGGGSYNTGTYGVGGAGGGGNGGARDTPPTAGTNGTGGGGGGGAAKYNESGMPGGSGLVIVRWGY